MRMSRIRILVAFAALSLLSSAPAFARGFIQSPELLDRIRPGVTTAAEVEQILGAPANRSSFPRLDLTSMDYVMKVWSDTYDIGVMIGKDGVVRELQRAIRFKGGGS
jgi:outer membrane protein assembly factor BamE (lipoprotein component of BamABCDE complex)